MSSQNIVGPLDYSRCKNQAEHGPLLHDLITKFNESHGLMAKAKDKADQTDAKFEVFKTEVEGKFNLVEEKIDTLKTDIEKTQTAVSGVVTTGDLSEQNKVLLAGIMEIVKGKNENKKAWIGVVGSIIVALIMASSAIVTVISNNNIKAQIQEVSK